MSSFVHAAARVSENIRLARDTFRIRLEAPALAQAIRPGQFLMLRLTGTSDPLLGRPFALYDTVLDTAGRPVAVDVVYLVVGKVTRRLAELRAGDRVDIWGPLGNGFPTLHGLAPLPVRKFRASTAPIPPLSPCTQGERGRGEGGGHDAELQDCARLDTPPSPCPLPPITGGEGEKRETSELETTLAHVGLVAGGIGQTPFLAYARELLGTRGFAGQSASRAVERVSLFYGARSADFLACVEDFRAADVAVHLATDDGSHGFHGYVTQMLSAAEMPKHLVGCGPEPMMKALAALAAERKVPCHLSLETPMACGVGICFSCVAPIKTADGWDYRRVCLEGPVFDAADLAW